jgi:hypothetical protein
MSATTVNAGCRMDRLPLAKFHRRVLWLIGWRQIMGIGIAAEIVVGYAATQH